MEIRICISDPVLKRRGNCMTGRRETTGPPENLMTGFDENKDIITGIHEGENVRPNLPEGRPQITAWED